MCSGSVDAGFILSLPFHHGDLGLCRRFNEGRRDATNASGRLASFSVNVESEEAGRFRKVAGVSIVVAAGLWMLASFLHCHFTTETLNLTVQEFRRGEEGGGLCAG